LDNQSNYQRHPWETSRKNVLHTFLMKSKINFPIDRIVDIGSGDAYVIHTLVEKNLAKEYFAIDTAYTPEVIKQLKENNNYSSIQYFQNIEEFLKENTSNVPTLFLCMDVLEHVENEKIILDFLNERSKDNYYFFSVPAFQSVFSSHDVLLNHYRRYTLSQLENVLLKNNFEIIDKGYYFISLLIFRKIDKWLKIDKKKSINNWNK
jgi:2-polyprenyl-3-methyl-5-hydroxy-6-metoxy-1,4-benzoquinol methylase